MAAPKPQYPYWQVIEIAPWNSAQIRAIVGGATLTPFKNMLLDIGKVAISGKFLQCEELYYLDRSKTEIDDFYPKVQKNNTHIVRNYVVIDTRLRVPVGYMSLTMPDDPYFASGVFAHKDYDIVQALAVYISWTCSFTMSSVKPKNPVNPEDKKKTINKYYAEQATQFTLKLAKFMHNQIAQQLLAKLGRDDVRYVLFYSIGAEEAREQHRKNGKLNTCTFVNEWSNSDGQTIPEFYNEPIEDNTMFYLYMPGGVDFVGSPLHQDLSEHHSDLSKAGDLEPGDPDYFKDDNWSCPSEKPKNEEMGGGGRRANKRSKKLRRHRNLRTRTRK